MSQKATPQQVNEFVKVVDEFMRNHKALNAPKFRAEVMATGNQELIAAYNSAVTKSNALKGTIEKTTGAWSKAKAAYRDAIGTTSTVIGDAIDEIRSWFGYKPAGDLAGMRPPAMPNTQSQGQSRGYDYQAFGTEIKSISDPHASVYVHSPLGALPAAALGAIWITGIIAAAAVLNSTIHKIFVSVEATRLQKANPNLPRSMALEQATKAVDTGGIFGRFGTERIIAVGALLGILWVLRKDK